MTSLIETLDSFNRKERYFVVKFALGDAVSELDHAFRSRVGDALGFTIPESARWWMDYHLDWLYAALTITASPDQERYPSPGFSGRTPEDPVLNVNANQEDVDLLVAFEEGATTHLVLLEAKADTGWTNKQVHSKARRLGTIFPSGVHTYPSVEPHFILSSPKQSKALDVTPLPKWMVSGKDSTIAWVQLPVNKKSWRSIERCDASNRPSQTGAYWRIKPTRSV